VALAVETVFRWLTGYRQKPGFQKKSRSVFLVARRACHHRGDRSVVNQKQTSRNIIMLALRKASRLRKRCLTPFLLFLFCGGLFLMGRGGVFGQAEIPPVDWELEQSRTYGRFFVRPIQVGAFPPVCVVEPISGPDVRRDFNAMRNPARPSLMVFCRDDIRPEWKPTLSEIDRFAKGRQLPVFLIVTLHKGVAPEGSANANFDHYLSPDQAAAHVEEWKTAIQSMGVEQATAGVAVNRFWRDTLGYEEGRDMIVAYVRGKVLAMHSLAPAEVTEAELHTTLGALATVHEQSR
jgi:hypothetical protein